MQGDAVLIVEDESIVALDLTIHLQKLGYEVLEIADNGQRAIELVRRRLPSLILMDVRLRGQLDGIETAQAIRREHTVPVIFLTSHSDDETVQRAAQTAPYGYLTKPYQIKELRAGIEVALTKARMERQLREADQWFAHALQCVADGVILTDLQGRVRFANPAAERLTGWLVDEAIGREVGEIVRFRGAVPAPDSDDASKSTSSAHDPTEVVRSVLVAGRPVPVAHALVLVARDGSAVVVDETAGPVNDDRGERLGAALVLRDATERVAQEVQLRASEERFRGAFDHAPLGMALVSFAGEFIQVNDALCRLLGAPAQTLQRLNHANLSIEADRDHEAQRIRELMSAPRSVVQFERRYPHLSGGQAICTLVSVSLMHEADRPTCLLYQVHDLTQQLQAAEQLAELAAERLKREAGELANASKSEFLSRVSHEMRTPLNAVIGFAQLLELQRGLVEQEKTHTYARHIRAAGEHLLLLVNDLLDLNRAAQGTLRTVPQALRLAPVVDEALMMLQSLAQVHGVELQAAIASDLMLTADPMRLRQVLINLGSNAIKYNRQGGQVRFAASRLASGCVRLTIEDTGIGMTPLQLERLFQPFERLGQERSKIPGVGLGLAIAHGLVQDMGGTLKVTSTPRVGTTLTVDIPGASEAFART